MMQDKDYAFEIHRRALLETLLAVLFIIGSYIILTTMSTILPAEFLMLQGIVTLIMMAAVVLRLKELVEVNNE